MMITCHIVPAALARTNDEQAKGTIIIIRKGKGREGKERGNMLHKNPLLWYNCVVRVYRSEL